MLGERGFRPLTKASVFTRYAGQGQFSSHMGISPCSRPRLDKNFLARALEGEEGDPIERIQWFSFRYSSDLPILVADKLAF